MAGRCGTDACPAIRAAPSFRRNSVIPVPRKQWAQIPSGSSAWRARRSINDIRNLPDR